VRVLTATFAVASISAFAMSAQAAAPGVIAAAPGSMQAGSFATPVVPMLAATTLTLTNLDAAYHSIASEAIGSDDASWCGPRNPDPEGPGNPRRYALGACPLFWSDLALPLGGSRPVLGIDMLQPGRAYGFVCGVYPSMTGVVLT